MEAAGLLEWVDESSASERVGLFAVAKKSGTEDRQIIDRRGANGEEDKIEGPSATMAAALILSYSS